MTLDPFRAHPLDGAALFFQPSTGTSLRLENDATRALRQTAPRVVMFGITNACNLRCEYCSRDAARDGAWTVASATEVLEGLSDAGVLEVAFGGGEPFAFRGFEELLVELRRRTPLALHVTTNGALVDDAMLARARGILGEVRLSLHEDAGWRAAAMRLTRAGQRWGANLLVSPREVDGLPARLMELAALGARDVALLSYVGPDPALHLGRDDDARLAAAVRASPLPCRASVCFGRRLDVPLLFDAGCTAGADFLTITPDRRVQSCSFQDIAAPAATASEILAVWRTRRAWLAERSPRAGCGRDATSTSQRPGLSVWQGFSGNNSGECVLVAKFGRAEDAQALVDELAPGFVPEERYGPAWQELFAREGVAEAGVAGLMPDEIAAHGRTFVAYVESALADELRHLRALAWTRATQVLPGYLSYGFSPVLAVVRAHDPADAENVAALAHAERVVAITHGAHVIVRVAGLPDHAWTTDGGLVADRFAWLARLAGARPLACELFPRELGAQDLADAAKTLGRDPPARKRLVVTFRGPDPATVANEARFADETHGALRAGGIVLVEDVVRAKRPALRAFRLGAHVDQLDVDEVEVTAKLWEPRVPQKGRPAPRAPDLDAATLTEALRTRLRRTLGEGPLAPIECTESLAVTMRTSHPAEVLAAIVAEAKDRQHEVRLGVGDPDPLGRALRRLLKDVRRAER